MTEAASTLRSRPTSQHSHHVHSPRSHSSHSRTLSPHRTPSHKSLHKSTPSSQTHNPSPLKMVTTTTTSHIATDESQYYYLPNSDSREVDLQGYGWMEPIVIDDEDLMFGGKSLSAWYEEERQTYSFHAVEEEERRGRQRVRQHHDSRSHDHHHHRSDGSTTTSSDGQKQH
ncbi:hypothetical protein F5X96DRAFT_667952 [Biscogniauxia mediterranea]|nr:hypothetical protein F5X96DRAFT_667952 [Biscogniauxia mediterranea]